MVYDERKIDRISHQIAEAIEAASFSSEPWSHVCEICASAFPGSSAALVNQVILHDVMNFPCMENVAHEYQASYAEYFAYINPWAETWTRMPSGSVFVAEKHHPSRTFRNSEFFNDWLLPSGGITAGIGLKIDASPTDTICVPLQYPEELAEEFDGPATEVSRRLFGVIERAISFTGALRINAEKTSAASAVVDRAGRAAFVLDASMRVVDANEYAVRLLSKGSGIQAKQCTLSFLDPASHKMVSASVRALAMSATAKVTKMVVRLASGDWICSLSRLPRRGTFAQFLPPRQLILLLIQPISPKERVSGNLTEFAEQFRLTPSEIALCKHIGSGETIQEAAEKLHISHGTARQRVKTIFQKTGVGRQSELCVLIHRFSD